MDDLSLQDLARQAGQLLSEQGLLLVTAESCTGGLVQARLTDVAGSSAWVLGGVVAYANAAKIDLLAVPETLIDTVGAVSEPVAIAMAEGVRARLGADIGVGVTGIAGPGGGSAQKPVGTVAIAVCGTAGPARVRTFVFPGDRETVRRHAVAAALDMIRRFSEQR